ncbi:odorant receptor 2a-like isoform X1 [Ostrinia furnacalis]|uniref:odorant receptor 2a-like isoform X1 n=1 Tax=Ostrinia furnacalis TaxID=93504 RepID=UPI00103DEC1E|nr:odorant receptor 2a-like isoform X1 [Ostrinia furnacalis]
MDKLARVMFLLLCHVTSITKQLVFYMSADKIDEMISALDDPLYNQPAAWQRALLAATARSAGRLLRAYSGTAVVTCTLWIIFPILYYAQGLPVEFPFWTNLDHSKPTFFVILLMYSYYVTTLVGIANTTMDAFMGTVLYQCKTQLRILRMNLENLIERATTVVKENSDEIFDKVLDRLFLECLEHYRQISETNRRLQDIFGTSILVQFGIGGWILCMAAYKMIGSDRMVEAVYAMEWLHAPLRFKRSLVLLMERAKRPLRPAAGLIIPLSLNTFVTILRSSYTFYAVLRQTK